MNTALIVIFAIFFSPMASAAEATVAGTVQKIRGTATAHLSETTRDLLSGAPVMGGDRIATGHNTRLALEMADGAILTLGADTEFVISDYRFSEKLQQGSATMELLKGAFRAITGAIGKLKERDFKIKTQVAVIGIRGTDFWGGFYFSEALDVALLGGKGIYVENAKGTVEVTAQGDGTTIQSANTAPSAPIHWGDKKIKAAEKSTSWEE